MFWTCTYVNIFFFPGQINHLSASFNSGAPYVVIRNNALQLLILHRKRKMLTRRGGCSMYGGSPSAISIIAIPRLQISTLFMMRNFERSWWMANLPSVRLASDQLFPCVNWRIQTLNEYLVPSNKECPLWIASCQPTTSVACNNQSQLHTSTGTRQ